VQLRLHYNVQPWVGPLTWNQDMDIGRWKALEGGSSNKFMLPAVKAKTDAKKS
jgi:signal peptidase complex subunit 3